MTPDELHRFEEKFLVDPNSGCWLWTGSVCSKGYGRFVSARVRVAPLLAHRVAYEHFIGPIPERHYVCHRCDVPSCVNPAHLFVGTQGDNMRDSLRKGRNKEARKSHCKNGHPLFGRNVRRSRTGARVCRACIYAAGRRRDQRKRQAARGAA